MVSMGWLIKCGTFCLVGRFSGSIWLVYLFSKRTSGFWTSLRIILILWSNGFFIVRLNNSGLRGKLLF